MYYDIIGNCIYGDTKSDNRFILDLSFKDNRLFKKLNIGHMMNPPHTITCRVSAAITADTWHRTSAVAPQHHMWPVTNLGSPVTSHLIERAVFWNNPRIYLWSGIMMYLPYA